MNINGIKLYKANLKTMQFNKFVHCMNNVLTLLFQYTYKHNGDDPPK